MQQEKKKQQKQNKKGGNAISLLLLLLLLPLLPLLLLLCLIETMCRHLIFIIHCANDVQSRSVVAYITYIHIHALTDRRSCCATPSGRQANRTRMLELCIKWTATAAPFVDRFGL